MSASPRRLAAVLLHAIRAGMSIAFGVCIAEVEAKGPLDEVDFVETWDARDFHAASDPSDGLLSHAWVFVVDGDSKIVKQAEIGNIPPQEAAR